MTGCHGGRVGEVGVVARTGAELVRQLHACRIVFTSPDLRAAQVSLAAAKAVDLAQLSRWLPVNPRRRI